MTKAAIATVVATPLADVVVYATYDRTIPKGDAQWDGSYRVTLRKSSDLATSEFVRVPDKDAAKALLVERGAVYVKNFRVAAAREKARALAQADEAEVASLPVRHPTADEPSMTIEDELAGVPQSFHDFLATRGLVYDPLTQVDLLASALGSQFLLFAGPSGTGKSTAARVLAEFLTPAARQVVIDARRSWTSSEDIVGQYSAFATDFIKGPYTDELLAVAQAAGGSPVMIVEEANLSAMEGYLGPVVTSASAVAFEELAWPLHVMSSTDPKPPVPQEARLGPWPRVFGTINVDSTAEAPAPKVSGRACVVLLEPPDIEAALASTDALTQSALSGGAPPGLSLARDPRSAWCSYLLTGTERFQNALKPLITVLQTSAGQEFNLVTPRDVQRCVVYMSWHIPLAEAAAATGMLGQTNDKESAENSLLHFVLPGLSSEQFRRAVQPLLDDATPDGLLARRLKRLDAGGESLFGVLPDFWASLS
jgi:energy-coupling factor transporter ATP-binding protein EcfA2